MAKLVDAKDVGGMYFVEYTVQKQPGPARHLLSLVSLANNGRYNRLYTVTAQCKEEQLATFRPLLQAVISSFQPPAKQGYRV